MHLNWFDKILLNYCGKYLAKKRVDENSFQPHKQIVVIILRGIFSEKKKRLANLYISERFFGFRVGKYSKGYEQFWSVRQNGLRLLDSIGAFCSFAPNVMIAAGNHPIKFKSTHAFLYRKNDGFILENKDIKPFCNNEKVKIGNDVWVGTNVTILPGVNIGDGAIIAAGAVVINDIPPYSIVGGVPAKVIKYRFSPEKIAFLVSEKWWNWSDEKIKNNVELMYDESNWY
ncbi:CatB-related O-acetyltransferase [Vibrio algivorus]|uniref:CatB-related O-acetyltransferase n=1 Tax=Vibrio algivorus TaxID=1667024 RepID=A0ABQ6EJI9_9VIBR|nr:CatB-related O-acetyltransferase [Vibrio algivorus]GLT13154.1 hypothetical protein GCM10007931_01280 [Vibrio algivorus]